MRDAGEELGRALLARAGGAARLTARRSQAWMSLTMDGGRHSMTIAMPDPAVAPFCAAIDDADLPLRDHLVASIAAAPIAGGVRIEALTIAAAA